MVQQKKLYGFFMGAKAPFFFAPVWCVLNVGLQVSGVPIHRFTHIYGVAYLYGVYMSLVYLYTVFHHFFGVAYLMWGYKHLVYLYTVFHHFFCIAYLMWVYKKSGAKIVENAEKSLL